MMYPVNMQMFMQGLFPIITFDMIPTDEIYDALMDQGKLEDDALSD